MFVNRFIGRFGKYISRFEHGSIQFQIRDIAVAGNVYCADCVWVVE